MFTIGVCPIKKSNETCENGWEKNEKQFPCWEIRGVTLHPTNSVSNICVSLHEHD